MSFCEYKHLFSDAFLDYLRNFQFACDVWAVPEGTPIFPGEPIVTVRGPAIQAQFIETMVLLGHQPSELDRHQSQPDRPCCPRPGCYGIRFPPGAGI